MTTDKEKLCRLKHLLLSVIAEVDKPPLSTIADPSKSAFLAGGKHLALILLKVIENEAANESDNRI